MKKLILALAAALTIGGGLAATPADAQRNRTVVRTTRTVVVHRRVNYNRGWHRGYDRGRHNGWRNHQRSCRTVWRGHARIRTCRSW
jgi:hypothetical protein